MTDSPTITTPVLGQAEQAIVQDAIIRYNNPDYSSLDSNGNTVMNLENFGFATVVRYKDTPVGVRIAEVDVVKAVCGRNSSDSGIFWKCFLFHNN